MTLPPFLIIGNPENRRVTLFQQALERQGQPSARVVSHLEALDGALEGLSNEPAVVRLDATGENADVEGRLLAMGREEARVNGFEVYEGGDVQFGQIVAPRQHHLGYLRYLRQLNESFQRRPAWRILQPLAAVEELFDKRRTSQRYQRMGVPVPEFIPDVGTPDALRSAAREQGWTNLVVKLSCSSSASCLAVYNMRNGRETIMTTMRRRGDAWFNSLRVQRVDHGPGIDEVLGFLLREGSQVERLISKARLAGAFMDCRVLMVAGEPAFVVVRQSRHLITNLHLGGWRGSFEELRQVVPKAAWEAAMESCRTVARAHGTFHLGVDLMFEPGFKRHRIIEANAFGDLLPNLTRRGLDVYEWQIAALQDTARRTSSN